MRGFCILLAFAAAAAPSTNLRQQKGKMPKKAPVQSGRTAVSQLSTAAQLQRALTFTAGGNEASLSQAQEAYMSAYVEAEAAGEAARQAKQAYEAIHGVVFKYAEAASEMVMSEVQREASEDAKKALVIRKNFEKAANDNAQEAAISIAKVYKKAQTVAEETAATWAMRAQEYTDAAVKRKALAMEEQENAQKSMDNKDFGDAKNRILLSHQFMDQAEDFLNRAKSAHKQADQINQGVRWYMWAERQAAMSTLAASMPLELPPPPLPPLP
mmetsp:Transcript_23662/g.52097  ORF Transcript_23662/g.52097 Transcript_23662/m.52097 type:complete len:270 (-) Transcript_23662:86-895(-)